MKLLAGVLGLVRKALIESSLSDHGWAASLAVGGNPVVAGECHYMCWIEYAEDVLGMDGEEATAWAAAGPEVPGIEEGFQGPDGKFYSRTDALAEWRRTFGRKAVAGADADKRDFADSEDLYHAVAH